MSSGNLHAQTVNETSGKIKKKKKNRRENVLLGVNGDRRSRGPVPQLLEFWGRFRQAISETLSVWQFWTVAFSIDPLLYITLSHPLQLLPLFSTLLLAHSLLCRAAISSSHPRWLFTVGSSAVSTSLEKFKLFLFLGAVLCFILLAKLLVFETRGCRPNVKQFRLLGIAWKIIFSLAFSNLVRRLIFQGVGLGVCGILQPWQKLQIGNGSDLQRMHTVETAPSRQGLLL